MKKNIVLIMIIGVLILALAGCSQSDIIDIDEENIDTFDVIDADDVDSSSLSDEGSGNELTEKFEIIEFYLVSGSYSRNVMQDDVEVLEMFALDSNNFLRVLSDDLEREVYAYNFVSDDFTYLYYFDDELLSKTVINVGTGAVVKDDEGYADMLAEDATQLKDYCISLLDDANILVAEIEN